MRLAILTLAISMAAAPVSAASRLKELVSIEGVRDNQLIGYGLVVGLNGTGDRQQTLFPVQSLTNMLQRMGISANPTLITVKNTAAVMVTATLPPYVEPGSKIDVTASSIGDAKALQGGLLLLTSLKGVDGQVYAVAQGSVLTGGFVASRGTANQTVNHPTAGRIPEGATVERAAPSPDLSAHIRLLLRELDFTTARRVAEALNGKFGTADKPIARAENGRTVTIAVPTTYAGRAPDFVAEMENLTVESDRPSKIVVNERTGTIVMGHQVHVSPVAIMHGNLSVEVQTTFTVSQPGPLSQGTTEVIPQDQVKVAEEKARNLVLKEGATVEELVRALNAIGSTPRDIIAILQSLRAAGALDAEVEVM